jgi:iron-sulfur cluster assembly protein
MIDFFEVKNNFFSKNIRNKNMSAVMEKVAAAPLALTASAIKELRRIVVDNNIPNDYGLRVGVKGGGCSGFSYVLGFDEQKETDSVYEIEGIKVLMQKSHAIYLLGMEVGWEDGLNNRGFTFENPNAKETCGCGTSFSA